MRENCSPPLFCASFLCWIMCGLPGYGMGYILALGRWGGGDFDLECVFRFSLESLCELYLSPRSIQRIFFVGF